MPTHIETSRLRNQRIVLESKGDDCAKASTTDGQYGDSSVASCLGADRLLTPRGFLKKTMKQKFINWIRGLLGINDIAQIATETSRRLYLTGDFYQERTTGEMSRLDDVSNKLDKLRAEYLERCEGGIRFRDCICAITDDHSYQIQALASEGNTAQAGNNRRIGNLQHQLDRLQDQVNAAITQGDAEVAKCRAEIKALEKKCHDFYGEMSKMFDKVHTYANHHEEELAHQTRKVYAIIEHLGLETKWEPSTPSKLVLVKKGKGSGKPHSCCRD